MSKAALMETRYLSEADRRTLISRLNRACGQVNAVRRMVEESECVDKLLVQIAAAKAAFTNVALELMEKHLVNCSETCMGGDREQVVRRLAHALAAVVRNA